MQKDAVVDGIAACVYFSKGKFLPCVDFAVRLWDKSTRVLFIIACMMVEGHCKAWESGAEAQYRLVDLFDFAKLGHVGTLTYLKPCQRSMMTLKRVLAPLKDMLARRRFMPCGCVRNALGNECS